VTEKKLLSQAVEKLKFVNAKIIGIVLNDVSMTKSSYKGYKRYGYGYGYGYYGQSSTDSNVASHD
jgi:Mrp family chromosome partitioning ATPase